MGNWSESHAKDRVPFRSSEANGIDSRPRTRA